MTTPLRHARPAATPTIGGADSGDFTSLPAVAPPMVTQPEAPSTVRAAPPEMTTFAPVRPGELFLGKYCVEKVIGRGGMGVVYAAHHEALEQRVAIKFLVPATDDSERSAQRFAREARAAGKIRNEHVAHVHDVGVNEDGIQYMILEYLEGRDLSEVIDAGGALPIATAVDYLLQAIDGVADAHVAGIVHRDLKPSNLFLTTRADGSPLVKVLDFGLAKSESSTRDRKQESLTALHAIMGTPRYMAPEQIRATKLVDHRCDVWSLGVILYEFLSGTVPFDGATGQEVFGAVLQDAPRPLHEARHGIPDALAKAVMACLNRDREARTQNVAELACAIAPFASNRSRAIVDRFLHADRASFVPALRAAVATPARVTPDAASSAATVAQPRATAQSWSVAEPTRASRGKTAWIGGALILVALLVGAWMALSRARDEHAPASLATPTLPASAAMRAKTDATEPPRDRASAASSGPSVASAFSASSATPPTGAPSGATSVDGVKQATPLAAPRRDPGGPAPLPARSATTI